MLNSRVMNIMQTMVFSCIAVMMFVTPATAATINYTLDDIEQDNGQLMTGSFQWTYQEGDFENGTGVFTELYIPGHGSDIEALTINFDITKSIEFSLTANVHSGGVNVSLFLDNPLTPTQFSPIDQGRSSYEIESNGQSGGFISGSISPVVVPLPASAWLFASGLIALVTATRRKLR